MKRKLHKKANKAGAKKGKTIKSEKGRKTEQRREREKLKDEKGRRALSC